MRHSSSRTSADRHGNALARSVVETVDDTKLMQEIGISLFQDEAQTGIERFVQYGFTAVPQAPTGGDGKGGGIRKAAEAIFSFLGGGRSNGIAMMVGDRRFRLMKLAAGEVALHDDQGHQIHLARDGIYTSAPNSKKVVHQVMSDDAIPRDGAADGQVKQAGKEVVSSDQHDKDAIAQTHTKQITQQTAPAIGAQPTGDAGTAAQLSGLINQVSALASGGVGLPALNCLGSQIASLAQTITATGGTALAGQIAALGNTMSTAAQADMAGLASQLSTLSGQLSSALGAGGLTQALHSHVIDLASGIMKSAFSGLHVTKWGAAGLEHLSSVAVKLTAPIIPHFGNITGSDNLTMTKTITAAAVGTSSDARLKSNIKPYGSALDRLMRALVCTFDKAYVATDEDGKQSIHTDDPVPSLGFIAQDFRTIFPELVHGDEATGFLSINEGGVAVVTLRALQEFVTETRTEMAALTQRVAELEARART